MLTNEIYNKHIPNSDSSTDLSWPSTSIIQDKLNWQELKLLPNEHTTIILHIAVYSKLSREPMRIWDRGYNVIIRRKKIIKKIIIWCAWDFMLHVDSCWWFIHINPKMSPFFGIRCLGGCLPDAELVRDTPNGSWKWQVEAKLM